MKVKTFQGSSMAEALAILKREFGRQAVILSTRTFTRGGLFGLGGKPCVEITAAKNASDLPVPLRKTPMRSRRSAPPVRSSIAGPSAKPTAVAANALLAEMTNLRGMVTDLVRETRRVGAPNLPGELYSTYQQLVSNSVAEEVASQLVQGVRERIPEDKHGDEAAIRAALAEMIAPTIPTVGAIAIPGTSRPFIVALVGPTGVGKTTTIAKLAANFCLREHRKVGLITIDTYRIAAVEQLKTYAQIINVPLKIAASADQLKEAVDQMSDRDIILIDTAGRSQRDTNRIQQLKAYFSVVPPHEVHLVLSSAANQKVLNQTIDRFSDVGVDRLIFRKLDEAIGFGVILNSVQKAKVALSYVTTGQDVPSDIEVSKPEALTKLILEGAPS